MSFSTPLDPDSRVSRRRFLELATAITAMCSVRADLWAVEERGGAADAGLPAIGGGHDGDGSWWPATATSRAGD